MATIAMTGSTGFVGSTLCDFFESKGYSILRISRDDLKDENRLQAIIDQADIVINLAGANIINRWSESYKKLLYDSRIITTTNLSKAINQSKKPPRLLISTSAVGIYDNDQIYHEENASYSDDFLSRLCQDWEECANSANTRVVIFRFGIVLGANGGALKKMLTPFKLGLGGRIGSGKQAFSFVHLEDLIHAFDFVIENNNTMGAYNLTAPTPTTNLGLTKALGNTLHRPTLFPVPEFVLQLLFSEGAKVLTDGQAVIPKRLQEEGFVFKYNTIEETIGNLC